MQKEDRYLSQSQAATVIGVTKQAVSYAVLKGLIRTEEIATRRLIRESAALAYKRVRPRSGWPKGKRRKIVALAPTAS